MTSQARAQGEPSVTMTLLSQPAWTGQRQPLDLSFQASNDSTVPLQSLTVELLVLAPARSRSLYELSIRSDVTSVITGYPFPQQGSLQPGQSRTRSEEHTSELQSRPHLVCRLLLEKKKKTRIIPFCLSKKKKKTKK